MTNTRSYVGFLTIAALLTPSGSADAATDTTLWIECGGDRALVQSTPEDDSAKPEATLTVEQVLPDWNERFWSGLTLKLEFLDQEDFFIEKVTLPPRAPEGEDREVEVFRPNPDRYVWKSTLSFDLGKFYRSPAQLKDAYSAVYNHRDWFKRGSDPLSTERAEGPLVDYFARARGEDRGARILSGVSGYVAIADRPRIQKGAPLPSEVFAEEEYDETYGIKIDPSKWFVTGEDWAAAYAATLAYARAYEKPEVLEIPHPCSGQVDRRCLNLRARRSSAERFLSTVLPVFEFKAVDQFDFIQLGGGSFVTSDLLDDTLETYTLTWDLSRAFGGAKERIAALGALEALKKMQPKGKPALVWAEGTRIPVTPGELLYLPFRTKGGLAPYTWSAEQKDCESGKDELLPGASLTDGGLLVGYPKKVPEGCQFTLRVRDAVGQTAALACSVADSRK